MEAAAASRREPGISDEKMELLDIRKNTRPCRGLKRPTEIGHFSLDDQRAIYMDRREARRCVEVPGGDVRSLAWDLNEGFAYFQWRDDENSKTERLKPILEWIMANEQVLKKYPRVNFVVQRGVMTDILTAPYEMDNELGKESRFKVCRFQNTVHVCRDKEFQFTSFSSQGDQEQHQTYWGYRFEGYITSHIEPEANEPSQPNNSAGFNSVVLTGLGDHTFLLAAEIDGELRASAQAPPLNYVELKTHRQLIGPTHRQHSFHRHKMLRTWAQSYAAGVPTAMIGFRDERGIVLNVKSYQVADLPGMCKNYWSSSVCLNFAQDFFDWLSKCIEETDPLQVQYEVTFQPELKRMTLCRVELSDTGQAILTPSFVDEMTVAAGGAK